MKVILVYDEPSPGGSEAPRPEDSAAEYEDARTIEALISAIQASGHDAEGLVLCDDFPGAIRRLVPDLVFNIAEGTGGAGRESVVPAWLDELGIAYTGSDAATMAISLDKAATKRLAGAEGVRTPRFRRVSSVGELSDHNLVFPLFVKPNGEGSSMGIRRWSCVTTADELDRRVEWVLNTYGQDCLVEEFAPGREFCVGILGNEKLQFLPIVEVRSRGGFYSYEDKQAHRKELICPADVPEALADEMRDMARRVYRALRCRDLARIDLKLDREGRPSFLEVNPLPGLSPYYGIFSAQAQAAGWSHSELIGRIIDLAIERSAGRPTTTRPRQRSAVEMTSDWDDWRWQVANRITTVAQLEKYIDLTDDERRGIASASKQFIWTITPYYASLMNRTDRRCPIRLQAVPSDEELFDEAGVADPLEEGKHAPVDLIIHVYPDRVAFCVGNRCAVYCRHCLRKGTMVGKPDVDFSQAKIDEGIAYIREHPEIRDVLLTGGDPLLMSDEQLERIIACLRAIPTVEVVRIGSRTPCTLPQRITPALCRMLATYHPIYLNTQFNHPCEITAEAERACARLASAGVPLGNQSVLLRGVNDNVATMKKLCRELMRIRVRPYYMYQCQTLRGTRHFRTPIECGIEIMRNLQGYTSGLAVPKYVLDTPYGKIPIAPSYVVGREDDAMVLRTYDGKTWREHNPLSVEVCPVGDDAPAARGQPCPCNCSCG